MKIFQLRAKKMVLFGWRLPLRDILLLGIGALLALLAARLLHNIHTHRIALAATSDAISVTWLPDTVRHWQPDIEAAAKRYNINPDLVAIIMTMESGGYPQADSGQAQGLMQIAPATAGDIASRYLIQPTKHYDLKDPKTSIEFGTAYLAKLRDLYGTPPQGPDWNTTVELIAAAYNGGFGAANSLENGEGLGDAQTVVYSRDAFNMWRERHAAASPTFERWKERGGIDLINKASQQQR